MERLDGAGILLTIRNDGLEARGGTVIQERVALPLEHEELGFVLSEGLELEAGDWYSVTDVGPSALLAAVGIGAAEAMCEPVEDLNALARVTRAREPGGEVLEAAGAYARLCGSGSALEVANALAQAPALPMARFSEAPSTSPERDFGAWCVDHGRVAEGDLARWLDPSRVGDLYEPYGRYVERGWCVVGSPAGAGMGPDGHPSLELAALAAACEQAGADDLERVRAWLALWRELGLEPPRALEIASRVLHADEIDYLRLPEGEGRQRALGERILSEWGSEEVMEDAYLLLDYEAIGRELSRGGALGTMTYVARDAGAVDLHALDAEGVCELSRRLERARDGEGGRALGDEPARTDERGRAPGPAVPER